MGGYSPRPITLKRRSAIDCIEAERATYLPSPQTLRHCAALHSSRGCQFVGRSSRSARVRGFRTEMERIGSNRERSITCPAPVRSLNRKTATMIAVAPVEFGDHVCERERGQHRQPIGKAVDGGKAAHRLDDRAEPRLASRPDRS